MSKQPGGSRTLSDELCALVRPYHTYTRLAEEAADEEGSWQLALRRPLRFLLLIGAFVSLSAAGRLVWLHVLSGILFWSFLPLLQVAGVLAATALVARSRPASVRIDLYFAGQAPWLLLFLLLAGVCLFAPRVYLAFRWLLGSGVLIGALLATIVWSTFLTWVFLRRGLALGRLRALVGMLALYAVYAGSIIGYFVATNQIQPLLWGA